MMRNTTRAFDTDRPAWLPPHTRVFGPVALSRVRRLIMLYGVVAGLGLTMASLSHDGHVQALGLGLALPGGGFLAHASLNSIMGLWHVAAALSAAGLFVLALGVWFGTGNILAPPAVWLGAAVWAASMHPGMNHAMAHTSGVATVLGIIASIVLALAVATGVRFLWARRQRRCDNAYLASATFEVSDDLDAAPEMSLVHLQRLRFALDRALQPVAEFGGFEWLDPFQTAAVRYQINFLAYAIALTQARFTPAFSGYMHQAQINLLDKQAQKRVWGYWGLENLWGNLRLDDNPVGRENIMYTGFVALQMTLLKANGGDDFTAPGRFRLNDRLAFCEADFIDRLDSETRRSDFTLFACEPNWIYPLCNTIGASAIRAHDPSRWAGLADRFRAALDSEFLDAFGRFVPCRSARTGLALPAVGGAMPLAMPCFFLNAIAPNIALRQWLLLRRRLFDCGGRFRHKAFWPIDTGNYRFTRASAYSATALAAAELGDRQVFDACMTALDDECPSVVKGGVSHRPRASVWAHGVELMALAGCKDGFRGMTEREVSGGPKIDGLPYPDVLVAAAHVVSGDLKAVLHGQGVFQARLTGLEAHHTYRFAGAASGRMAADGDGEIVVGLHLDGRTIFSVEREDSQWRVA